MRRARRATEGHVNRPVEAEVEVVRAAPKKSEDRETTNGSGLAHLKPTRVPSGFFLRDDAVLSLFWGPRQW